MFIHAVTNRALYDDNAICMLNIIFYSECLYDYIRHRIYKCKCLYTV